MHISSLPGKGGVGSMGEEARGFVDFLKQAGQCWWQVLPLTPPASGNSPYSSYSVFAGNPAFISLEDLEREKLLTFWARKFLPKHGGEQANYSFVKKVHMPLLRQTFQPGMELHGDAVSAFRRDNSFWLEDYALFMAIKWQQKGAHYHDWPRPLRLRNPDALKSARLELRDEIAFWVWVQFLFFRQWKALKRYAHDNGVSFIGDMPIYADVDSADVWANPGVFQLDPDGRPAFGAGVPPDFFSKDGQFWGNPLYDWNTLQQDGYRWWMERLRMAAQMYDRVRLDHFRALDAYFSIPAGAGSAKEGVWKPGPGIAFLNAVREQVPQCSLIAEDLGVTSKSLRKLLEDSGLPGMKVLQFAFNPEEDSSFLPHHFVRNCVGYTGTHDNDTLMGWFQSAPKEEIRYAAEYLRLSRKEGLHWGMIRGLYATCADTVIVPIQDFLGLDSKARMNIPAMPEGNWIWRADSKRLTGRLAADMRRLASLYGRIPSERKPVVTEAEPLVEPDIPT